MSQRPIRIRVQPGNLPKWDHLAEHDLPLLVVGRSDNVVFLDQPPFLPLAPAAKNTIPPCGEDGRCSFDREQECLKQFGRSCFSSEHEHDTAGEAEAA